MKHPTFLSSSFWCVFFLLALYLISSSHAYKYRASSTSGPITICFDEFGRIVDVKPSGYGSNISDFVLNINGPAAEKKLIVPVTSRTIQPGEIISEENTVFKPVALKNLPLDFLSNQHDRNGAYKAKFPIAQGQLVRCFDVNKMEYNSNRERIYTANYDIPVKVAYKKWVSKNTTLTRQMLAYAKSPEWISVKSRVVVNLNQALGKKVTVASIKEGVELSEKNINIRLVSVPLLVSAENLQKLRAMAYKSRLSVEANAATWLRRGIIAQYQQKESIGALQDKSGMFKINGDVSIVVEKW